jgi:hypothetical protein
LRILCATLAEHTSTPRSCWFCLWDGYGWLHGSPSVAIMGSHGSIPVPPAFPAEVLGGPRVRLPGRDYLLLAGSLAAAPQLGWADPYGFFFPQSPNLFWPQDQAWCVASEIDMLCTLVAGSDALAGALVGDPRLEAWRAQPDDPIAFDSDQVNTQCSVPQERCASSACAQVAVMVRGESPPTNSNTSTRCSPTRRPVSMMRRTASA